MATISDAVGPGPADAVVLLGRSHELETVDRLLDEHRLVTIAGTGGVGKSRLAAAVVARRASVEATAVCELIAVPDPRGVGHAIAESLGFPSLEAAAVGLASRPTLLLLDNTEHVIDAAADATEQVLATCATVTVLTTGREPLEIAEERVVVVEPLPVPLGDDPELVAASPAAQLFLARARAAGADVNLDAATAPAVAAICRRLDGLPLAIELAAARARALSPNEILRHLDRRFDLLARRRPRGPARHHSLETAITWSHQRLEPSTRRFFDRLGAFCGPFTAEAAAHVAGRPGDDLLLTLERLDALVSRSLVRTTVRSGQTWYELLESLRAYARERLQDDGELTVCDELCVDFHVGRAAKLRQAGRAAWSLETFAELMVLQLNLGDAIRWCLRYDEAPDRAFALFAPLWGIVHNGRADIVDELGTALLARWPEPDQPGWDVVGATTATAALVLGDHGRARSLAQAVSDTGTGGIGGVVAARAMYLASAVSGEHEAALAWVRRGIDEAEAAELAPWAVELEVFLALALWRHGDTTAAVAQAQSARDLAHAAGTPILVAWADLTLASLSLLDDPPAARRLLVAAVTTATDAGYPWGLGTGRRSLGALALVDGDLDRATTELAAALDLFVAVGQLAEVEATLRWVAALLLARGRREEAHQVLPPHDHPTLPMVEILETTYLPDHLSGTGPPSKPFELAAAVAVARRMLASPSSATLHAPTETAPPTRPTMVREGAVWALSYHGATIRLPDSKGLQDLAALLGRPGRDIAATELMGAVVDSTDLGPQLDATARRAYERRIVELQAELDEAESFADSARAERARDEFEQLVDALAAGTGLGGRPRQAGGSAERARSAVSWRIRAAIRRIADLHVDLGAHLDGAVRTGRWCTYAPADGTVWHVAGSRSDG